MTSDAAQFWENHYRTGGMDVPDRPNPLLAEVAGPLPAGHALDLACGRGGDTVWLAGRGWRVTAVDISTSAVAGLAGRAAAVGVGDHVDAQHHDLAESFPAGEFDLVSAQYFQTPFPLDRVAILRKAAQSVRPGGRLLVVDHGSIAPWSWNQDVDVHFPTPAETAADLELDPHLWQAERTDMPTRRADGPGGQRAEVVDNVLLLRRTGS